MEMLVRNAEGNLTPKDRDYAAKKLGKLDRYFHTAHRIEMVHRAEKLTHRVEVTVFADGFTLRGEESDASVNAAIDKLADKLENRLRRVKSKLMKAQRAKGGLPRSLPEEPEIEEDDFPKIRERKTFLLKPMGYEEACLQLELLGHPFFVFRSQETNQTEVLYKRRDGAFGLLSPHA
jgi:putative sigma-54 modulation protein